jgi:DnaK suppressor protein
LERIENGTFGQCESCEEDISIERLKARPVTTQCITCKTREENMEKALGI